MTGKKPTLNPGLFKGLTTGEPSPPQDIEPLLEDPKRPTSETRRAPPLPQIESSATSTADVRGRRYQRLHLYVTDEMLRRVRQMQAEALAANLPMGQRGPSVVVAAALDCFEWLSPEDRLEAIKKRLKQ